jgi:hypothetical protein
MQMIGQDLKTLDEKASEPLECASSRATNTPQRETFEQQAFAQTALCSPNEVWLAALDKLASTIMAVMVLLTSMSVPVFRKLGGLAPWPDVSDHHGVLLTSAGWGYVCGQP